MEQTQHIFRFHYRVTGQVQGVGFRYRAYYAARGLGLTGWVQNQWDDSVELEVQGTRADIGRLLEAVAAGRYVSITGIHRQEIPLVPDERSFVIRDDG